jgi:hypothetical protein
VVTLGKALEIDGFYFAGFGWICKTCQPKEQDSSKGRARIHSEGEGEAKTPRYSSPGLAKWRDAARQTLYCPACGAEEAVNKA